MANRLSWLFTGRKGGLLYSLDHAAFVTGRSSAEVFTSAEAMCEASIETAEQYDTDLIVLHSDPFLITEAAGGTVEFPHAGPAVLISRPDPPFGDVESILRRGRIPLVIDVVRRIVRHFDGSNRVIAVSVTGPFSLAGSILGETEFLTRVARRDDPLTGSLLTLASGVVLCFIESLIRTGASIMVAEPLASLVHERTFRERVVPSLIGYRDMGDVFFHLCGGTGHLLDAFVSLSPISISLDEHDLDPAVRHTGSCVRYMGGIDGRMLIEEDDTAIREHVTHMKKRFRPEQVLICTGCDMVWNTPRSRGRLVMDIIHGKI